MSQGPDNGDRSDGFSITICKHKILLNTDLFFYYLFSIFHMFPSLTLAAASPTCPSPAPEPWVSVIICKEMEEVGADKLQRDREIRDKEKLHTGSAVSF